MIKNKINGMNINKIEFKLLKTTSPSLLNIPNTAIAKILSDTLKKVGLFFHLFLFCFLRCILLAVLK